MTKASLLIAVSGAALALAACGRDDRPTENTATTELNVGTENGVTAEPAALSAQGFANNAAASDRFEIETSKLAATAGQSSGVKSYAAKMISAHEQSTAKLKAALAGISPAITPNDALSAEQQATLDSLRSKTGSDFDAAYKTAQVDAHQKALDALNNYASSGDNEALKSFAKGLSPTVAAHLNMAKGLK